jgi:hypothetical protein
MDFTINSANLVFDNGEISHVSVNFSWNNGAESSNNRLNIPFEKVTDLSYANLKVAAKEELIERLTGSEETGE